MAVLRAPAVLRAAVLSLVLACCACQAARRGPAASSKPGWGWRAVPEPVRMTVRAVPASARPSEPAPRLGKPGWGPRAR